ncbi:MAG: helix-turn-helix domain-containing protein [Saprospiraceae bacterium]|nr:helix-turn-helix domain-containing protein [Saprospiraceae bacterium]
MNIQKSIVVLPFENTSPESENEYFADGVTEELINALGKIPGLKVTARTSSFAYKGRAKDIRIIGKELGVNTILEGSIRKSQNRVRVNTQLIRAKDGFQIWSERIKLNIEDIFEVQDRISLLIADQIRENFGHFEIEDQLVMPDTNNLNAYSAFLKGRYYQLKWDVNELNTAVEYYKRSIQIDPSFYKPFFGLVQCYGYLATWGLMDKEKALQLAGYYFNQGFKLNNNNFEAYFALANKTLWVNWQPNKALVHLKQALLHQPSDPEALESAAECHLALGSFQAALDYINRAIEVNPLSSNHYFTKGNIYYMQECFSAALECFDKALQMDSKAEFPRQVSANCYILMGNRAALDGLVQSSKSLMESQLFESLYDAINEGKSIATIEADDFSDVYLPWRFWTLLYDGKEEEALECLSWGIENRLSQYINFQHDPLNNPLKSNPKFRQLANAVFDEPLTETISPKKEVKALLSPDEQEAYIQKLEQLMMDKKVYKEPTLSLRTLAKKIGLNVNRLSWLFNKVIGTNFNEYVNKLRLAEFKRKAPDPSFSNYTILGVAYECGFNSKSVFNEFFKKVEGVSPSIWLKTQKNQ